MRRWKNVLFGRCLVGVLAMSACPDRGLDPAMLEHREEACDDWCRHRALDPDCPSAPSGRTLEECVSDCVRDEGANWTPDGHGEDLCGEEQVELFACEVALTCDEREEYKEQLDALPTAENTHCRDALVDLFSCAAEHAD